jgi:hypothetical protein
MVYSNQTPGQVKDDMRLGALEKEILRLKIVAQKQSKKLHRLRKVVFFLLLFFAVLFFMLAINGFFKTPNDPVLQEEITAIVGAESDSVANVKPPNALKTNAQNLEDGLCFKIPENGILFSVQIGAYAGIEMAPFKLNLLSLQQYSYEGINQYSVGLFTDHTKAQVFLDLIKQMGFKDAFLISTEHGRRIAINEALEIQTKLKSSQPLPELQPAGELLNQSVVVEKLATHNP